MKSHASEQYGNKNLAQQAAIATFLGIFPSAALSTLPERKVNLLFQDGLLKLYPSMLFTPSVSMGPAQLFLAFMLRAIWKAAENGVMSGGGLLAKKALFEDPDESEFKSLHRLI